jgi:3-oxoacyl-[acyl-carrier-protein] synthase-3
MHRPIPYSIDAVASIVGKTITVNEWVRQVKIPNRKVPGTFLSGEDVTRITGIQRKAWDPERFRDITPVVDVTRLALERASAKIEDIDMVIMLTSTPFLPMLNMDGFELLRRLGCPDHIVPLHLHAGCAAMARAMHMLSYTFAKRALIVAYEASSAYMLSPLYYENEKHPLKDALWMSPAIFSDGAAAAVLTRQPEPVGFSFYSRDSQSFGDDAGFVDPLVHYLGGGGLAAPGTPGAEELAVFAMNGEATKRYYQKGMMLNHRMLERGLPGYLKVTKRVYAHQASPRVVEEFRNVLIQEAGARPEQVPKNVDRHGNLVAAATFTLMDEDLAAGAIASGDRVCFSVVGAGPERGGFITVLS